MVFVMVFPLLLFPVLFSPLLVLVLSFLLIRLWVIYDVVSLLVLFFIYWVIMVSIW